VLEVSGDVGSTVFPDYPCVVRSETVLIGARLGVCSKVEFTFDEHRSIAGRTWLSKLIASQNSPGISLEAASSICIFPIDAVASFVFIVEVNVSCVDQSLD
jgi:hypothetical protein